MRALTISMIVWAAACSRHSRTSSAPTQAPVQINVVTEPSTPEIPNNPNPQTVVRPEQGSPNPSQSGWLGGSPLFPTVGIGSSQQTHVGLWIDAPVVTNQVQSFHRSIALVMDSSGSMRGAKMNSARQAALQLVSQLRDGEMISLYTFANHARQVVPPTLLTPVSRQSITTSIMAVRANGETNLSEGLSLAMSSLGMSPSSHPIRQAIILSDGRATTGITNAMGLGSMAASRINDGVSVSTIGVGLDYDEHLLTSISRQGSGRLYHADDAAQIASILQQEATQTGSTIATEALVEITAAPGVSLLGVEGLPAESEPGRIRVRIGSLFSGRHHEVLLRTQAPTHVMGQHPLAFVRLVYRDIAHGNTLRHETIALDYRVAADSHASAPHMRVQMMLANHQAATAQLQAVDFLNSGNVAQAEAVLSSAERQLREVGPAPAAFAPASARLNSSANAISTLRSQITRHRAARPMLRSAALHNNALAADAYQPYQ